MLDNRSDLPIVDFRFDRSIKSKVRQSLNGHCVYCGCKPRHITVDHVVPIAKGGDLSLDNLVPACRSCNLSKGDHDVIDWWKRQPFYSSYRLSILLGLLSA